jgi:hypothetical protein
MDIDVTEFWRMSDSELMEFSASIAEMGECAGKHTWNHAKQEAERKPLVGEEGYQELREYFVEFGAWSEEEIATWDGQTLNALLVQFIAGDIREREGMTLDEFEKGMEDGTVGGRLSLVRDSEKVISAYYYVGM